MENPLPRLQPRAGGLAPSLEVEAARGGERVEEHEVVHFVLRDVEGGDAEACEEPDGACHEEV
jgi:hypothetical protein